MKDCIATVGTFDGLHIGHYFTLHRLICLAKERGMESRVITFANHPLSVVAPHKSAGWLTSRAEVEHGIIGYGVDNVTFLNFTTAIAALTAGEFMHMIAKDYGVKVLMMGFNNSLGSDRLASQQEYVKAGAEVGVEVAFAQEYANTKISSSLIREHLRNGQCQFFTETTGAAFHLSGTIARGRQIGRTIGIPTLNLALKAAQFIPCIGVYAGCVAINGKQYDAVINIGTNPTVAENGQTSVEAFVPNVDLGDCYGAEASFTFLEFMRGETKFGSIDLLKEAINHDVDTALAHLPQLHASTARLSADFHATITSW
jgi:riboflavin kinase/FMN adenylyltransferase